MSFTDGASPKVVSSTIDKGKERVQSGTNHKLDFKYDGRSNGFNHIDGSVVSARLKSLDNEELNDSDRSSPLLNNYIDGVSLSWRCIIFQLLSIFIYIPASLHQMLYM